MRSQSTRFDGKYVYGRSFILRLIQKYHSIAARGENVEEVLRTFETSDGAQLGSISQPVEGRKDVGPDQASEGILTTPLEDTQAPPAIADLPKGPTTHKSHVEAPASGVEVNQNHQTSSMPSEPPPMLGMMQDETTKNLMMSWYYAGYYAGLHEGRQNTNTG